jgi:hypothetical protein
MAEAARLNGRGPSVAALAERLHAVELAAADDRGKLGSHEAVCAERYGAIDGKLDTLQTAVTATAKAVQGLTTAHDIAIGIEKGTEKATKPKWWAEPVLIALLSGAMMLAGWVGNHWFESATKAAPVAEGRR